MATDELKIITETERLLIRELVPSDEAPLFEMDSDPEVVKYVEAPLKSIAESRERIASIRQQYQKYGSGRYAVVEKATGAFIGYCGLRFVTQVCNGHTNYYSIGYQYLPRYWGKAYATEAAAATLEYGFTVLNLTKVFAMSYTSNVASDRVLEKIGMKQNGIFINEGREAMWYELSKDEWLILREH